MHSPFYNTDKSVERASRIISGLLVALFVSVDSTLAVGMHTGELQERVLVPGQVLTEYTVSKIERWAETMEDTNEDNTAENPDTFTKNVNVTVTGGSATSVTTTVNGETKSTTTTKTYTNEIPTQPTAQPYTYTTPAAPKLEEVDYNPPAWFVERSEKSQAEFDAKAAQSKAEFDAYAAKSKAEFDAAKAAAGL